MRFQGKLTNWNDEKGFGFVEPNGGGKRSFVHIKSFTKTSRRPIEGDLIVYQQIEEANGKFKAMNISLAADRKLKIHKAEKPKHNRPVGRFITVTFSFVLLAVVGLNLMPVEVLYFYLVAGCVTYMLYAIDKSAAQNDRWRTPESQLHMLSLIGGWPFAFYAQNRLKHKSRKKEFQHIYWVTVLLNLTVFAWLFSEQGQKLIQVILG